MSITGIYLDYSISKTYGIDAYNLCAIALLLVEWEFSPYVRYYPISNIFIAFKQWFLHCIWTTLSNFNQSFYYYSISILYLESTGQNTPFCITHIRVSKCDNNFPNWALKIKRRHILLTQSTSQLSCNDFTANYLFTLLAHTLHWEVLPDTNWFWIFYACVNGNTFESHKSIQFRLNDIFWTNI